jgi:hypothetical protein
MTERPCRWCGFTHGTLCPAVKSIEFADDGVTVRRVEFHSPVPVQGSFKGMNLIGCTCPPNSVCGNVACPRRVAMTASGAMMEFYQ